MELLEKRLAELCERAAQLLPPMEPVLRSKLIVTEQGSGGVQLANDERIALAFAFGRMEKSLQSLDLFDEVVRIIAQDEILSDADKVAGYWGDPKVILQMALTKSLETAVCGRDADPAPAIAFLRELRHALSSPDFAVRAEGRLLGVELADATVQIDGDVTLARLSVTELNERQPFLDTLHHHTLPLYGLGHHHTVVRATFRLPVHREAEAPMLSAQSDGHKLAKAVFSDVVAVLRLHKQGRIDLGPVTVSSIMGASATDFQSEMIVPHKNIQLAATDAGQLRKLYNALKSVRSDDKVLSRAFDRFTLGTLRAAPSDKIVDLVIAWESLLLTVNGQAQMQESTYRFAMNGSALLRAAGAQREREIGLRFMKCAYGIRSGVVHGGDETEIAKRLRPTGMATVIELATYLEEAFRKVFVWLTARSVSERPYRLEGGWERLQWDG